MDFYGQVLRPVLFRMEAESAHHLAIRTAEFLSSSRWLCEQIERKSHSCSDRMAIEVAGIRFRTPLGLAAGFDKSARAIPLLAALAFGHVEVGSISADPSDGNPLPRLFRIPEDQAIVVNYGLPNDGSDRVAARLARVHACAPVGVNIVSTNRGPSSPQEPDDAVVEDYARSIAILQPHADYLSLNLSCPNTRDGRGFFHARHRLRLLLDRVDAVARKPVFLKVAPFAAIADLEAFLEAVDPCVSVAGFSINLPPGKPRGLATPASRLERMPGAVSGPPAAAAADDTLRELYRRMDRSRFSIIGSGGIATAQDAYRKIRLGASLVQLMTSLVYRGPAVPARICEGLERLLEADGFGAIGQAVGVDARAT